ELGRVLLGLSEPFSQRLVPSLCLYHSEFLIAINKNVVGGERLAALPVALNATRGDAVLAQNAAAVHNSPAGSSQRRVDVLRSCLCLIHHAAVSWPLNA